MRCLITLLRMRWFRCGHGAGASWMARSPDAARGADPVREGWPRGLPPEDRLLLVDWLPPGEPDAAATGSAVRSAQAGRIINHLEPSGRHEADTPFAVGAAGCPLHGN